jgi:hypothetical protein
MGGAYGTHERGEQCIQNFSRESLKGNGHFGDLGTDGRKKLILKEIQSGLHSFRSGRGPVACSCEHDSNEPSGSMKDGKCLHC